MKLNNKGYAITVIVFGILIVFIIVLSSLLVTMNNSVKLNKVVKEEVIENIQLGVDTTGMSLTERIEQLELQMSNVKKDTINEIYPVGSIYISTTDDNIDDVIARFGGEWEKYSQGRTLVGEGTGTDINGNVSTFAVNNTGGEYSHTLTIDEVPSHGHNIPSLTGTTSKVGQLSNVWINGAPRVFDGTTTLTSAPGMFLGVSSSGGTSYLTQSSGTASSNSVISFDGRHNHTITTTTSNTENTGSGASFGVQDPYIAVYMYKRIK